MYNTAIDRDNVNFKLDEAIWDYIATNLITQGRRSSFAADEEGDSAVDDCAYRGNVIDFKTEAIVDHTKCAVGWVIDDEHYDSKIEGLGIFEKEVQAIVSKSIGRELTDQTIGMLSLAQHIHDSYRTEEWVFLFSLVKNRLFDGHGKFGPNSFAVDYIIKSEIPNWIRQAHAIFEKMDEHRQNNHIKNQVYYNVNPELSELFWRRKFSSYGSNEDNAPARDWGFVANHLSYLI